MGVVVRMVVRMSSVLQEYRFHRPVGQLDLVPVLWVECMDDMRKQVELLVIDVL